MRPSTTGDPGCGDGAQAAVIAFLSNPASYAPRPERVDRLETHGALVFLAGDEAWKIKRALRFPYMDFSTLEKRKAVCAREVEINRRLAPELYLGAVPITRAADGGLRLGGDGEVVEWAVRMRAFDQAALLSRIAATGPLAPELVRDLADAVYESHQAAQPAAVVDGAARFERLIAAVSATLAGVGNVLDADALQRFGAVVAEQWRGAAAILDERAAAGFVRRCHGDLHLNNIVLWQGRPVLFDALEFDDELATIDTLYDLAFLLMDLDQRGQRVAANAVLNRTLWRSGVDLDLQGLRALPLFLGLRSAVRAMVTAERAAQEQGETAARSAQGAARYLDAAVGYLSPAAPRLVAVGGLSGTGKSTLARALAPDVGAAPGAVHLRSDLERKAQHGVSETTRLGPDAYTVAASTAVYAALCRKARLVLATGQSCIVDAVFADPDERADVEAVAADLGVPFQGLWLQAPAPQLIERVTTRTDDASDATSDVVRQQLARGIGRMSATWSVVDAGASASAAVETARGVLGLR
ncbi:MAG TPA: AAA family ATPase [Hyphomicrobiaceae bacterium]|nr:AAA family ATPase [Hyphomicrobiaceae bacterium]